MNKNDALKIIKDEELIHFNWFNDHDIRPNKVNMSEVDGGWS